MPKLNVRVGGVTYKAPFYETVDAAGNSVWHVFTAAGLLAWASAAASSASTGCVLHSSIDLTGEAWTPVGTSSAPYTGCFDGGGHAITGLAISATSSYQGFFGYIGSAGECKNLHLHRSCSVSGGSYVGGIAGYNAGTLAQCTNSGTVSGSNYVGGVAGYNAGTLAQCSNSGSVALSASSSASSARVLACGGVAGYNAGTLAQCSNSGSVTATGYSTSYDYAEAGGVAGHNAGLVSCCANSGTATARTGYLVAAGGAAARQSGGAADCCANSGTASGSGAGSYLRVGGVIGDLSGGTSGYCANTGSPSGSYGYSYT